MARHRHERLTEHAREPRARQTKAESLLWYVLRARRLCGLKFRRQYPVPPFIADFACLEKTLIVEIDGGYHDHVEDSDLLRQAKLESAGWTVLRFRNEDVLSDVESVALAIVRHLKLESEFPGQQQTPSP